MRANNKKLPQAIAWMIRRSGKEVGKSREVIAAALSISPKRMARIERGTAQVSVTEWFLFCRETGIFCDSIQMGFINWKGTMEFHHEEMRIAKKEIPQFFKQCALPPRDLGYTDAFPGLKFDLNTRLDIGADNETNLNMMTPTGN